MGIINAILGNASSIDVAALEKEYAPMLCDGEQIEQAFVVIRDKWIFTNKRLILQDIQGVTGSKRSYRSIPYGSINMFSVETAGTFDTDSEMKIWVKGLDEPIKQNFGRKADVKGIQRALASYVL